MSPKSTMSPAVETNFTDGEIFIGTIGNIHCDRAVSGSFLSLLKARRLLYSVLIEIMPAKPLNNYIRTRRRRTYFSQEELAFLMGSKSGTKVSRYERERRDPTLETALALEAVFGVPIRELFAGRFHKVERSVGDRARALIEKLRLQKPSAVLSAKLQALSDICNNPRYGQ